MTSYTIDTAHSHAVLIGASEFPKDNELPPIYTVGGSFDELAHVLANVEMFGIPAHQVHTLFNPHDNTTLKEQLVNIAEKALNVLFCFVTGHIINRKGQYYLATNHSSKHQIHVNGIPVSELFDLVRESEAVLKIFVFDVHYTKLSSDEFFESDVEAIRSIIEEAEKEVSGLVVFFSNPLQQPSVFQNNVLQAFITAIKNGVKTEEEFLSINQLYDAVLDTIGKQHLPLPLRNKKTNTSDKKVAYNQNYILFNKLVKEAEDFFAQENYISALDKFQQAAHLFHGNAEVKDKIEFIKLYQEAESLFAIQAYEQAFKLYEDALRYFDSATISQKVWASKEKLADMYYGQENFEAARQLYEDLSQYQPDNTIFTVRFRKCTEEIQFFDLTDEGDKYYFENNFEKAHETYKKALQIKYDHKTQRRKLECERFLEREKALREKIADAVKREIEDKYKAELAQKLASMQTDHNTQIDAAHGDTAKIEEKITQELNAKYEETFWTRISIRNDIESYKLYLDLFPNGVNSAKAQQRIVELEQIKPMAVAKAQVPDHTASAPQEVTVRVQVNKNLPDTETVSIATHSNAIHRIKLSEQRKVTESAGEGIEQLPEIPQENPLQPQPPVETVHQPITMQQPSSEEMPKVAEIEPILESLLPPLEIVEEPKTEPKEVKYLFSVEDIIPKKQERKPVEEPEKVIPIGFSDYMSESELWETASRIGTVEAYTYYVDTTKDAAHIVDAYYMINKLNKENITSEVSAADSIINQINSFAATPVSGYKETPPPFYKKPLSEPAHIHNTLVDTPPLTEKKVTPTTYTVPIDIPKTDGYTANDYAFEDKLWSEATAENTLSSYYNYINNTVIKRFWNEAKDRIKDLKEEAKNSEETDWKSAKATDTVEAYRAYVRKYPLGNYYAQAMFRINELG